MEFAFLVNSIDGKALYLIKKLICKTAFSKMVRYENEQECKQPLFDCF